MDPEILLARINAPQMSYAAAAKTVRSVPGIYAFFGGAGVWETLGLGLPPDGRPLYVGKSEKSLKRRPIADHFGERSLSRATSPTGSSSPRRTLATLLRTTLSLQACPRNPDIPGYYDRFGLDRDCDLRLTKWMRENLLITLCPIEEPCDLKTLEESLAARLEPPLYLDTVFSDQHHEWVEFVVAERKILARQAKAWTKP